MQTGSKATRARACSARGPQAARPRAPHPSRLGGGSASPPGSSGNGLAAIGHSTAYCALADADAARDRAEFPNDQPVPDERKMVEDIAREVLGVLGVVKAGSPSCRLSRNCAVWARRRPVPPSAGESCCHLFRWRGADVGQHRHRCDQRTFAKTPRPRHRRGQTGRGA